MTPLVMGYILLTPGSRCANGRSSHWEMSIPSSSIQRWISLKFRTASMLLAFLGSADSFFFAIQGPTNTTFVSAPYSFFSIRPCATIGDTTGAIYGTSCG